MTVVSNFNLLSFGYLFISGLKVLRWPAESWPHRHARKAARLSFTGTASQLQGRLCKKKKKEKKNMQEITSVMREIHTISPMHRVNQLASVGCAATLPRGAPGTLTPL